MGPAGAGARGGGRAARPTLWSKLGARKVRRRPKRSGSLEHMRTFSAGGPLPTAFNAVGHGVHHVDLFAAAALAHAAWFSARRERPPQGGLSPPFFFFFFFSWKDVFLGRMFEWAVGVTRRVSIPPREPAPRLAGRAARRAPPPGASRSVAPALPSKRYSLPVRPRPFWGDFWASRRDPRENPETPGGRAPPFAQFLARAGSARAGGRARRARAGHLSGSQ